MMEKTEHKRFNIMDIMRHCFTLIELLVVVAIIAILAGILLPALNQARQKGLSISCTNNAKEIARVLGNYSDDYDEYIVPANNESVMGGYWYRFLAKKGTNTKSIGYSIFANQPVWGSDGRGIWHCPAEAPAKNDDSTRPYRSGGFVDYGLNYASTSNNEFHKRGQLKNPSMRSWIADTGVPGGNHTGVYGPCDVEGNILKMINTTRHGGHANMTFHDGHCEGVSQNKFHTVPNTKSWGAVNFLPELGTTCDKDAGISVWPY